MLMSKSIMGVVASDDFRVGVALGKYPGWRSFRKFGMNDAVVSSTAQEMWPLGTPRTLQTSAFVASVVSDDAADTSAGTGLRTLTVQGLDADYKEVEEIVTLAGLTPVTTTQEFLRINRMFGSSAGSSEWNEGNITASLNGATQAYVETLEAQTHQTQYTVPVGHTVLVTGFTIETGRMSGSTDLHIVSYVKPPGANQCWRAISDVYLYNSQHTNDYAVAVIPEKYEIKQVIRSTTSTQCTGIYSGYLVSNIHI